MAGRRRGLLAATFARIGRLLPRGRQWREIAGPLPPHVVRLQPWSDPRKIVLPVPSEGAAILPFTPRRKPVQALDLPPAATGSG